MTLANTSETDRLRRRDLLLEASKRRLDRIRDKLTQVQSKLADCRAEERERWQLAEHELADSYRQEQQRIHKLEGAPGDGEGALDSAELPPSLPSVELPIRESNTPVPPELTPTSPGVTPPPHSPAAVEPAATMTQAHAVARNRELEQRTSELTQLLEERHQLIAQLQESVQRQAGQLARGQQEAQELRQSLQSERAAQAILLQEKGHLEESLGDLHQQLRKLENHDQSSNREVLQLELERSRQSCRRSETLAEKLQESLDRCVHELEEKISEVNELHRLLLQAEEQRFAVSHEKSELEQHLAETQQLLQDELQELHLQSQAALEKATRERELKANEARLKTAEIDQLRRSLDEAQQKNATLQQDLQAAQNLLDEAPPLKGRPEASGDGPLEGAPPQGGRPGDVSGELEDQLAELRQTLGQREQQLTESILEIQELREQQAELQRSLNETTEELGQENREVDELQKKLQQARDLLEAREQELVLLRPLAQAPHMPQTDVEPTS